MTISLIYLKSELGSTVPENSGHLVTLVTLTVHHFPPAGGLLSYPYLTPELSTKSFVFLSFWFCTCRYHMTWTTENPPRQWNTVTVKPYEQLVTSKHVWHHFFLSWQQWTDTNLQVLSVRRLQLSFRTPGTVSLLTIEPAHTQLLKWSYNQNCESINIHLCGICFLKNKSRKLDSTPWFIKNLKLHFFWRKIPR